MSHSTFSSMCFTIFLLRNHYQKFTPVPNHVVKTRVSSALLKKEKSRQGTLKKEAKNFEILADLFLHAPLSGEEPLPSVVWAIPNRISVPNTIGQSALDTSNTNPHELPSLNAEHGPVLALCN